ncbi:MAG: SDR family oxidoreductase [Casimicrobiaceae bacterium]
MDLQGKVIVITGAAQGLGRKMAEVVAGHGARIALVDLDDRKLGDAVRAISGAGTEARDYPVDVTSEAQVEALFKSVRDDFGSVDGLISNAGTNADALLVKVVDGKVQKKMSSEQFDRVIAVDLRGVFLCGREAAVHMVEGGRGGAIINVSSISRAGNVGQTNYAAAKAGVAAMTVTWAKELARYRIRVAGIAPGFSDTRMVAGMSGQIRDRIIATIPLRRLAAPEEIARAALFILQDDYYNGRILEIDGGLRI